MSAALGIRVKSGWASAVLLQSEAGAPEVLHRARLLLADPKVPQSAQPYHRGFGSLQKDRAILDRLTGIVYEATARSLSGFVTECRARGHEPTTAALVVGSTIDPDRITNEHIRAHAYEAHLFRSALEQAAAALKLPCAVTRERDLPARVASELGARAATQVAALGRIAGRPWRADEKLATLAAWVTLAQAERRPQRHH